MFTQSFVPVDNRYRNSGGGVGGSDDNIVKSRGLVSSSSGLNMSGNTGSVSSPERALLGGMGGSPGGRAAMSYSNDRVDGGGLGSPGGTETLDLSPTGTIGSAVGGRAPPRNIFDDL